MRSRVSRALPSLVPVCEALQLGGLIRIALANVQVELRHLQVLLGIGGRLHKHARNISHMCPGARQPINKIEVLLLAY